MSILVAYDGKEHTRKALEYAARHAYAYTTRLYIFSAIVSNDKLDSDVETEEVSKYLEEAVRIAEGYGVHAESVMGSGTPWKGILEAAERFDCDTIVVGRAVNKSSFDRAVLGSVSDAVVRNAKCVVIVVQ